jgi:hypothetical protein
MKRIILVSAILFGVLTTAFADEVIMKSAKSKIVIELSHDSNELTSLNVSHRMASGVLGANNSILPEKLNSDQEGTVSVNMRNRGNGNTVVTPSGFDSGFYIGEDNNFCSNTTHHAGSFYQFVIIGKVDGLSDVLGKPIPRTGWTDIAAVNPGYGYIARYRYRIDTEGGGIMWENRYIRIYVVREILEASEREAVLGAEIQYVVVPYDY